MTAPAFPGTEVLYPSLHPVLPALETMTVDHHRQDRLGLGPRPPHTPGWGAYPVLHRA